LTLSGNSQARRLEKRFSNRRNWLFADTVKGAKASAILYGLVETAKVNGVEPYAYLRRLFERLSYATTVEDFEALLPFSAFNVAAP
jgi:transposase